MSKEYRYYTKAVPMGNGKRKYIRAKTKRELNQKVLDYQLRMAKDAANVFVAKDMTVNELTSLWLEKVKCPSVRPQTYYIYEQRVKGHVSPAIGDMKVCDVKPIHIIDLINSYGYKSRETNKGLLSTVRSIFSFAVENEIIQKSPVPARMTAPGRQTREDRPLTPDQTKRLLEYCRQDKDPNVYLFTFLALVTGMRRGELMALRWDCVDLSSGLVKVRRQLIGSTGEITDDLKTSAAKRDIPISPDTVETLRSVHASSGSTYVLCGDRNGHLSSKDVSRYERAWNRSGVSCDTIHAHQLRKTFATRLIETGTDPKRVQYLLGHTTLDMTLRIYAKYDQESQAEATRALMDSVFGSYAMG